MTRLFTLIISLVNLLAAYRLFIDILKSWGVKDIYHVSTDELKILIQANAEIIFLNKDGGDGTFTHRVKFLDHEFMHSTTEEISTG